MSNKNKLKTSLEEIEMIKNIINSISSNKEDKQIYVLPFFKDLFEILMIILINYLF